jgi:16S rRNA (guanine1207-N2)-methyltransferase
MPEPSLSELLATVAAPIAPPVAIVLGSPRQAAALARFAGADVTCYQMDLYPARRLEELLRRDASPGRVVSAPDLWDLPADFQTVIYPAPEGGERILKIDMVEQGFQVLRPGGTLVVLSPYRHDPFFPGLLQKTFGKIHAPVAAAGQVIWAVRRGDRPRRRHEVTFHATVQGDGPLRFLSRPGLFAYGRLDAGARALLETAVIQPGDAVLDLGCGPGCNGIFAGRRTGTGAVTFTDSNLRAIAVTELNAQANGLPNYRAIGSCELEGLAPGSFDVVLANPPYYAQNAIARWFIEGAKPLLRPRGRFYLVTKKWEAVGPIAADVFGHVEVKYARDYAVLFAQAPAS